MNLWGQNVAATMPQRTGSTDKHDRNNTGTGPSQVIGQESQNAPGRLLADGNERRSLREKFNVDAHTGGANVHIAIHTSPGRSGFGPSLGLVYNSGTASTNGPFGVGWHLDGVDCITRKTSVMIPTYNDEEDVFVHSSMGDLVPMMEGGKFVERQARYADKNYCVRQYRPRCESEPVRIERWSRVGNPGRMHWRAVSSTNNSTMFGTDADSQIFETTVDDGDAPLKGEQDHCFSWLACESYDGHGNQMTFCYMFEDGDILSTMAIEPSFEDNRTSATRRAQRYLKSIKYGNNVPNRNPENWAEVLRGVNAPQSWNFEVVFDYGEHSAETPAPQPDSEGVVRPDPFSVYTSGFEVRTYRRCERVLMFHHFPDEPIPDACLVAATKFHYEQDPRSGVSRLRSCVPCGYSPLANGKYSSLELAPSTFEYWKAPEPHCTSIEKIELDICGLSTQAAQWVDLDGDGAPGILAKVPGGGWYYHPNNSDEQPAIGGPRLVPQIPNSVLSDHWELEDITGDGQLDITSFSADGQRLGVYERAYDAGAGWVSFSPFESRLTGYSPAELRKIDMNGNGLADLLSLEPRDGNGFVWYPSLGQKGYGAERRTTGERPHVPFSEETLVSLCDMTGDGLSDIVIISHGHVCYWPNMGHGRFGEKVVMGNPPSIGDKASFSPLRIRMADVTGSRTADLIYSPPQGGALLYYNQSGNKWSNPTHFPTFPVLDRFSALDVFDIGGRGTQCLCWTSDHTNSSSSATSAYFIDLMGGHMPGLLTRYSNGVGATVSFKYRSSAHYRFDDERVEKSWALPLPFPIHCVADMTTVDEVAETSCTMKYAYHNGYYDPRERQFRGFQMVEKWQKEDFATVDASSQASVPLFSRPRVHTKSWFYVGCQKIDQENDLPGSYSQKDLLSCCPLRSTVIRSRNATRLSVEETQDGFRALAGHERRQEIFSGDTHSESAIPLFISQRSYEAVLHQKIDHKRQHGIFRVNSLEEVSSTFDRQSPGAPPEQPRVRHTFVLKTDDYGNICRHIEVNYGKRDCKLTNPDKARQQETVITYSEFEYTNALDLAEPVPSRSGSGEVLMQSGDHYFEAPLPARAYQYRVYPETKWVDTEHGHRYLPENFIGIISGQDGPPGGHVSPVANTPSVKVLTSALSTSYSTPDLTKELPFGVLQPFSVKYQTYQLALSLDQLQCDGEPSSMQGFNIPQTLHDGGYTIFQSKPNEVWVPSTRKLFKDSMLDNTGTSSLTFARANFYIPNAEIDQYGNISHSQMDRYNLLLVKAIDVVKNETLFHNDYARLQPTLITDANKNRREIAFDPCGREVGFAVMGKIGQKEGDSLHEFQANLNNDDLLKFIRDPAAQAVRLLKGATQRTIHSDHYRSCKLSDQLKIQVPAFYAELSRYTHYYNNGSKELKEPQVTIRVTYRSGQNTPIQSALLVDNRKENITWQFNNSVIHNINGEIARYFLPHHAPTHHFRTQRQNLSVPATTLLQDALNRTVGQINPDQTWSKIRFSPWCTVIFDAGDTVGIEHPSEDGDVGYIFRCISLGSKDHTWPGKIQSSTQNEKNPGVEQSKTYIDTPTTVHLDALGREIVSIRDNGVILSGLTPDQGTKKDMRETHTEYDEFGNVSVLRDARGRVVTRARYDLLSRPLHTTSMDAGHIWSISDCSGKPLLSRQNCGPWKRFLYDGNRRKKGVKLVSSSGSEELVVHYVYGEENDQLIGIDAEQANLKGQVYQCWDQSGKQSSQRYDLHGNCVESSIRYSTEYRTRIDWSNTPPPLDETTYKTTTVFDALGHPVESTVLDGENLTCAIVRTYDVAGRLQSIVSSQDATSASISNIEYTEDNKIRRISYGNGSTTTNCYDTTTRRLTKCYTKGVQSHSSLQTSFVYDCMGRIVQKSSNTPNGVALSKFTYDALGQLIKSTGREEVDGSQKHLSAYAAHSTNSACKHGGQMINYEETYQYDVAGNIEKMQHDPQTSGFHGWTRNYSYMEPNCEAPATSQDNQLRQTTTSSTTAGYKYDVNGCLASMPGYSMEWGHNNKLRCFHRQKTTDGNIPEKTWYIYNAQGQRVRKVTDRSAAQNEQPSRNKLKETLYLPMRDIYTKYNGSNTRKVTTVGVGDSSLSSTPLVMVEMTQSQSEPNPHRPLFRYQISDHLELDDNSNIISYEEFSPYGASTYQYRTSQAPRKYRFASYQRDSESGLYLCGARYYIPWLGRWSSPDPLGTVDGLNLYCYVANDPLNLEDPRGTMNSPWQQRKNPPTPAAQSGAESVAEDYPALGGASASASGGSGATPKLSWAKVTGSSGTFKDTTEEARDLGLRVLSKDDLAHYKIHSGFDPASHEGQPDGSYLKIFHGGGARDAQEFRYVRQHFVELTEVRLESRSNDTGPGVARAIAGFPTTGVRRRQIIGPRQIIGVAFHPPSSSKKSPYSFQEIRFTVEAKTHITEQEKINPAPPTPPATAPAPTAATSRLPPPANPRSRPRNGGGRR